MSPQRASQQGSAARTRPSGRPSARTLTRQDWIDAALALCADEGFARVAVEPLARRLHATKGSFYWHFPRREDLLVAMLEHWEHEHTHEIMKEVDASQPRARLAQLLAGVFGPGLADRAERAILSAASEPLVAPIVARVHQQRIAYVARLLREAGQPAARAETRARFGYAAYLGHLQLVAPEEVDARAAAEVIAESLMMMETP